MNPGNGRFTQQDSFDGVHGKPQSLHKYGYAEGMPTGLVDPSGHLASNAPGLVVALNVAAALTSAAVAGVAAGAMALAAGPGFHIRSEPNLGEVGHDEIARNCAQSGRRPSECNANYPILFLGSDVLEHTKFVEHAIQSSWLQPNLHYYQTGHSRAWLRTSLAGAACGPGKTGGTTGKDCDEYPFASSIEGGKANYEKGMVALKAVDSNHNQAAGRLLFQKLLSPCGIKDYSADKQRSGYVVVPVPALPFTIGRCANGSVQ